MQIITATPKETQTFAQLFAKWLSAGDVICLNGDLGAGKTTFTQGLANGLGISGIVNSPTFTLIQEYAGRLPLYHMDLYRLGNQADQEELGIYEYIYGDGITVIEWSDFIHSLLPEERWIITIERISENERSIQISGIGERPQRLMKEWEQHGISRT